jgi:hypothetical protein
MWAPGEWPRTTAAYVHFQRDWFFEFEWESLESYSLCLYFHLRIQRSSLKHGSHGLWCGLPPGMQGTAMLEEADQKLWRLLLTGTLLFLLLWVGLLPPEASLCPGLSRCKNKLKKTLDSSVQLPGSETPHGVYEPSCFSSRYKGVMKTLLISRIYL